MRFLHFAIIADWLESLLLPIEKLIGSCLNSRYHEVGEIDMHMNDLAGVLFLALIIGIVIIAITKVIYRKMKGGG